ncbi:unnamed protein product, partial [Brassica oleracea]
MIENVALIKASFLIFFTIKGSTDRTKLMNRMLKWSYSDEYAYYLSICHMDGVALTTKRKSTTGPSLADELELFIISKSAEGLWEFRLRVIRLSSVRWFYFASRLLTLNKKLPRSEDDKSCEDFPIENIIFLANETARELSRSQIFSFVINAYKLR